MSVERSQTGALEMRIRRQERERANRASLPKRLVLRPLRVLNIVLVGGFMVAALYGEWLPLALLVGVMALWLVVEFPTEWKATRARSHNRSPK